MENNLENENIGEQPYEKPMINLSEQADESERTEAYSALSGNEPATNAANQYVGEPGYAPSGNEPATNAANQYVGEPGYAPSAGEPATNAPNQYAGEPGYAPSAGEPAYRAANQYSGEPQRAQPNGMPGYVAQIRYNSGAAYAPTNQYVGEQGYATQSNTLPHTPPHQQSNEQPYIPPEQRSGAQGNAPVYQRVGEPAYYAYGSKPGRGEFSGEDAKFSEVGDEAASVMYTPGIRTSEPFQQRARSDGSGQTVKQRRREPGRFLRALCLVLVCAVFSGAASYAVTGYKISNLDLSPVNQVVIGGSSAESRQDASINTPIATAGKEMDAQDIYDMACNQVVGITTEIETTTGFFGQQGSTTAVSGSGFIISSDGYILTNYHVIETAYMRDLPIIIHLSDETTYEAEIIGYESNNDIALLKIDASGLSAATIANSNNVRVGQRVYAVGNPFGELVYTMTEGIVSALDRVVTVENKRINTLQISAAVNPGNSGCPVYDTNGEVIGIVSAKFMSSSVEGIGFAIPINDAIDIASDLIEHGYIPGRAYMGITAETVTSGHVEYFGLVVGAYVKTVTADSAADRAGLKVSDVITKLGDNDIDSSETLVYTLRKFNAGDTTTLMVRRSGEDVELTITFDENLTAGQPQRQQQQQQPAQREGQGRDQTP